ncbi:Acetylornithine aminotransferase 1 [Thiomonas arsenitoxydans]|uniref:Acetylornithine aminotransferase n=1 Tax=Thiomonas arsenitoxydans (strain DSM 22701 / CIP 110005 / 3As) TaxID=426114 RepID=D6CPE9_THIA3|nr:acetylornithine transaminase [Thiomonas arsenitoxydans]CAZ87879.1 Acetylornithine aminotransferase [Thiomonas arsenitoxydans]CQR26592.1 Acetylornithine aminotransferase 1 [Thiomonas arsenitoxydans]CQR27344.1 Acetylornithine aminotransferase 1 [Thiomonas arsenitoxydans]CQR31232.1 Acetylornithine aminotransferase 1 [Thiomonas arsenitoxydans]CQR31241.1 Acetylornithine aminotransferase 1 [Thiomonas arsenitoxydans]
MPSHVMNTYARLPIALAHGEGAWVWDTQGKRYLDALSGIAVNTLGHAHPRLVAALTDQVGKLIHTSNLYQIPLQEQLADRLCALGSMDTAFFCNSGLEANEAAIKLARLHGHNKGIDRPEIVVFERAFHGRSLATLSATGNPKVQKGFEPLVEGFVRVPLNDASALQSVAETHPNVVAVFIEAIQGEGGIQPAHADFLRAARTLCDRHGWLLMIDEVQCGTGRTGKWFAHQWAGVSPDVIAMAKGLASGVPIGAILARGAAATTFGPGQHGTTFGGNPLACRAALETLAVIEDDGLLANAQARGEQIQHALRHAFAGHAGVVEVRGQGLMIGIELDRPAGALVGRMLERGVLLNVTQERVVRLLPPLIFTQEQADALVQALVPAVLDFLQDAPAK